jgi:hypothetical protein
MKLVTYWSLNLENKNCPLCKKDLMDATQKGIQSRDISNKIVVGKCLHGFHEECHNDWVKSGNTTCFVDKNTWQEDSKVDLVVVSKKIPV